MKNFILAVTSFIATVLLFSQVALGQSEEWSKNAVAAQGDEPAVNTNSGRSQGAKTEGYSPDSGETDICTTCKIHRAPVQALNRKSTLPVNSPAGSNSENGASSGQKGTK